MNPFTKVQTVLQNDVVTGMQGIIEPIAVIAIIICCIGALWGGDEMAKTKFKWGLLITCIVTGVAFMAPNAVSWLKSVF